MARKLILACVALIALNLAPAWATDDALPNILLIALDDMGHDTPESFGGRVEGLTPHIDRLAAQGMKFTRAYNTSSRCSPSRGSIMTGHYQDNYAVEPGTSDVTVKDGVLTIPEYLAQLGYLNGLFGKDTHYRPIEKYGFDEVAPMAAMAVGRSPELYAKNVGAFIDRAMAEGRPFFVSANTHDPHRPYAGAPDEQALLERRFKKEIEPLENKPVFVQPPAVSAWTDRGIPAPAFVPDHELAREEFGYYLNSSHRADQFVGAMMRVLEEKGRLHDTLVIFHSDNGMHWPFAKSNVYLASVKTPFVIYWQGRSVAGTVSDSLVSTIDIVPTILEAVGLEQPEELHGKSLLPLLTEPERSQHERVFATINAKGSLRFEMRSVIGPEYIYIYNKWADGTARYHNEKYPGGLALEGMHKAAETNAQARERLEFFYGRTREELYHVVEDPDALENLATSPLMEKELATMRQAMLDQLTAVDDPFLDDYRAWLAQVDEISTPVLEMDFESAAAGSPAHELLQHERLSLALDQGVAGSTGLRAEYVGYHRGSMRIVDTLALPQTGLEFSLNYDVRFDPVFQFVKGGKLHGLGPKNRVTGGRPIVPEGWSARVMFRTGGEAELYTYHQDMQGQYGDHGEVVQPFHFSKGNWHSVTLHVRVNDPATASNGFSRLYVDGDLVQRHENLRLRGEGGAHTEINDFLFSSFHGGHEPDWAPKAEDGSYKTVHATFDNIEVYKGEHIRSAPD